MDHNKQYQFHLLRGTMVTIHQYVLVDMSILSRDNRFFVYDMVNDTIQSAGLVTHGRCNQMWLEGRKYSMYRVVAARLWVNTRSVIPTTAHSDLLLTLLFGQDKQQCIQTICRITLSRMRSRI
jgi:hypothetical protein